MATEPALVLRATIARLPEKVLAVRVAEERRRLETEAMRRLGRARRRRAPRSVAEYEYHHEDSGGVTITLKVYLD